LRRKICRLGRRFKRGISGVEAGLSIEPVEQVGKIVSVIKIKVDLRTWKRTSLDEVSMSQKCTNIDVFVGAGADDVPNVSAAMCKLRLLISAVARIYDYADRSDFRQEFVKRF
jgi:hypothetical protein